jgi:CO dehydrogenase maturation factor
MPDGKNHSNVVIAVCGKGGVGKTSISAAMVKILVRDKHKRILAIDADPAVGLASALGITARKTVDDIRNSLIQRIEDKQAGDKQEVLTHLDYEMLEALTEKENLAFLAIGRPEKEGCYCQANSILKDIIASIAHHFDYVVIDGEAGIEQLNRRVMEKVSHLVLIADASAKAIHVAQTIQQIARNTVEYSISGLVVNRCRNTNEIASISIPKELQLLGWVPEDDVIRTCDIQGKSVLELPVYHALDAVERCLQSLGLQ